VSTYFELQPEPTGALSPADVVTRSIESGYRLLLADHGALPPEFFDLSSRFAGELVQKLSQYGIRMAGVVPDPESHSQPFQDFLRETNRGNQIRFFPTREAAIEWLTST
jgi:Domain of unknown function (DUF4180)